MIVLDLKGDPALVDNLERLAHTVRVNFKLVSLSDDPRRASWNPIEAGSASSRAARLTLGRYDGNADYYKRTGREFLTRLLDLLDLLDRRPTIPEVAKHLQDPKALLAATKQQLADRQEWKQLLKLVDETAKDRSKASAVNGLTGNIRELSESELKPALEGNAPGGTLDLVDALTGRPAIVVFSLSSASSPDVASMAGSLALRDIHHATDARQPDAALALLVVDEFSALDSDEIKHLLERARGKRVGVVLSTQSLADLDAASPTLTEQTLTNTATKIVHRSAGPNDIQILASLAGTETVPEHTEQTIVHRGLLGIRRIPTGAASRKMVEQFVQHPNRLRSLKRGHAAVILRADRQWSGFARIHRAEG